MAGADANDLPKVSFLSLVKGAILGASLTLAWLLLPIAVYGNVAQQPQLGAISLLIFGYATVIWLTGPLVIGTPMWLMLHKMGFRGFAAGGLLGFVLCFGVIFCWRSCPS